MKEIDPGYKASRAQINTKISAIPGQIDAEIKGLEGKQTQAFDNILQGARNRGLGFAGIPIAEQAQYTASEFLPAVARTKQAGINERMSLQQALNDINLDQRKTAMGLWQQEQDRAQALQLERERRAAEERARAAAAASSWAPSLGGLGGGSSASKAGMVRKKDGGFAFTDSQGRPVSAAIYAAATGKPFRQLLQEMASAGDKGAKQALGFVGDDFGYDPGKLQNRQDLANIYNSLIWGAMPTLRIGGR